MDSLQVNNQKDSAPAPHTLDLRLVRILSRIGKNWYKRAQVMGQQSAFSDQIEFDHAKPDFLPELLPFRNHPLYLKAPQELQDRALSCGWLIYNQKTFDIESKIVNPVCLLMLENKLPGVNHPKFRDVLSETMVDECYHIQLVVNACDITREQRGLNAIRFPAEFNLVQRLREQMQSTGDDWKKRIAHLATAIVSEVFISNYLKQISEAHGIQPINRITVHTHRQDELAHSEIFSIICKSMFSAFNEREKVFFAEVLPKPVGWFADFDLNVWLSLLQQISFPGAEIMINDCQDENKRASARIDYSELITLANDVGISQLPTWIQTVQSEGLVQ